jgi:hypothetical protein
VVQTEKEDAMMTRVLLCGICLIGIHAGAGMAQTLATQTDSPVTDKPVVVDGPAKMAPTIPEIIKQPNGDDNVPRPKLIGDPGAVLTPPTVNLQFLRAIRLDWDHVGDAQFATK